MSAALPPPGESVLAPSDAAAAIAAIRSFLAAPVFERQIALAVLGKLATDEKVSSRERLRASEALGQLQLKAMELLATITGAKEQQLKALGIETAPHEVNVTQHNTKIEIVRQAPDWRTAEAP